MVIGRPMGRFYWQNVGESVPCQVPGHSRPTQGVSAEAMTREVTKGLREIARREAMKVTRSPREAARREGRKPGPGSRCPQWLAALMESGGQAVFPS